MQRDGISLSALAVPLLINFEKANININRKSSYKGLAAIHN